MGKKYQSKILQVIHEDMKGLHRLGIISDERMREFDEDCLVQEPKSTRKDKVAMSAGTGRPSRISAKGAGV